MLSPASVCLSVNIRIILKLPMKSLRYFMEWMDIGLIGINRKDFGDNPDPFSDSGIFLKGILPLYYWQR